jgi:glucokinase
MTSMPSTTLLGIDIGGTKIAGALIDAATGNVLYRGRVPTNAAEGGASVLQRAVELARTLIHEGATQGIDAPEAVGIGAGGQIDSRTGVVLSATDILPGWAGQRIAETFEQILEIPAAVDNDVNALAVGECRFGAGRGFENLVYLALGTGVGGAIISNGKLHYSHTGVSGELGHLILVPDGLPCTCGGKGCLEQYVSGPALRRQFQAMGGKSLPDGTPLTEMARQDPDSPAARAIRLTGDLLGIGLTTLANIFGPERIIIGGGLAALGDLVLEPARKVVTTRALAPVRETPIVTAALGPDASVIGAACLALPLVHNERPV